MKHLKSILFLLLCLAMGVGIGKGYLWLTQPAKRGFENSLVPTLITGIGDAPAHRGFTLKPADLATLPAILLQTQTTFATTMGLEYGPALTPSALAAAVKTAHQNHLALVLLPPANFTPENPYPRPLRDIAAQAQAAGVDYLCISWFNTNPDEDYWRQQVQAVRAVYQGKIIFAGSAPILPTINCLDITDLIGAIGPLPLPLRLPNASDDVSIHDMRVAWDSAITSLESLVRANTADTRKIALLNMNVPREVSAKLPPIGTTLKPAPNPELQRILYQALLLETKGRSQFTDILLFNWGTPGQTDAPNNLSGLFPQITEAWDPKKPAPPAQPPIELQPEPDQPDMDMLPETTDSAPGK